MEQPRRFQFNWNRRFFWGDSMRIFKSILNKFQNIEKEESQKNIIRSGGETSQYKSPFYSPSQDDPYNPDELVSRKGLDIFDKMEHDDQVKAAYELKKFMILAKGFEIKPASKAKIDVEIADFIDFNFRDGYQGEFTKSLSEVLSALQYGFSVTEKLYKIIEEGDYKGKIGLKTLKTRPPHSFEFHIDDFGNLKYILQHQMKGDKKLNPNKFLIYTYRSKFGEFYGISDFRDAYRAWFVKDQVVRYHAVYLERHAIPLVIGTFDRGTSTQEQAKLEKSLSNLQAKTTMIKPTGIEVDFKGAEPGNEKIFEDAIAIYDTQITRAFLLPELLGFTIHKTGSQALGREQFDMFYTYLGSIQKGIEDLINDSLIKDLVDKNYSNVHRYPTFVITRLTEEERSTFFDLWFKALEKGAAIPTIEDENIIREELGFPLRDEKDSPNQIMPKAKEPEEPVFKENKCNCTTDNNMNIFAVKENKTFGRAKTEFEEKVNFTKVEEDYNKLSAKLGFDLSRTVHKIENSLINDIENRKIIKRQDFKAVNNLKINKRQQEALINTFQKNFNSTFRQGRDRSKEELNRIAKFKQMFQEDTTIGTFAPIEAIDYLKNKSVTVSGTEEEFILKNVQTILTTGMKNGKSESEIVFELEEFFDKYETVQKTPDGKVKPIEQISGRLQTVSRTNISDAYNQGRISLYNSPSVRPFVDALQYSAIIDSDTTVFCSSYDTKIFKSNDPIWNNLTPPNHFNCRSTAVPIITGEEFDPNKPLAIQQPPAFGGETTT
jgi:SPP1 gp7 family putative phage head morphogenesis protein